MPSYLASIGMEVHAELDTRSKMFCRCPVAFGGEPNTRVCPVCLGLPGSLPVPNRAATEMVLRTALALNCTIATNSVFHRKNYFYPDLPKGYQVSQYGETNPIGYAGWIDIPKADGSIKRVRIRRVHLEEDTGKLMHLPAGGSGVDFNRSGVPLMEIVTDFPPDIESAEEAKEYLVQLRSTLLYLGVCDGKMEEGSLRCEPNISVRPEGSAEYGTKTELKNLNSFRSVQLGVRYEIERQIAALGRGERIRQETRGWHEGREESFPMRTKEEENDYRYFPDPDLVPMAFDEAMRERARTSLPELPLAKARRYAEQSGLSAQDCALLTADQAWAEFFEQAVALGAPPKPVCNWMNSDFAKRLNEDGIGWKASKITPAHLVDLVKLIESDAISGKTAKEVFAESFESGEMPSAVVLAKGLVQISDRDQIEAAVREAIEANPASVAKYKSGQTGVAGFFVGQVMRATGGQANPGLVQEAVKAALEKV
ncbi:MAG: Asp-tRNA(Asn)/Glu-tRNA(Gln) amidotransferase subunit GatB [Fimbriimonas ginsengisoli]|uniref:Aspartyl/glutamyl-tRNA(Asn/Gln) amidotransferase subunit B n=1 Tax=Fimbriimonas ginsengisoli TaxID=1005039 RepID=A0A931LUS7_FIMGI|nr:Asp-tRNA(Asn)/Glu-tRNA(Gln) amidotransferase subunit GatB [Fimbriimonas ginsengisoli]